MSNDNLPAVPQSAKEELALAKSTTHTDTSPMACLLDTELFNHLWRVATAYSRSFMVPDHFRGKADDCFVAAQLALRLEIDLFMLMQNMYVVHGKPGMEAKLAIALCNDRGPFRERIQWKFEGEGKNRSCTAFAHDKQTGNLCEQTITWAMVEAEGWNKKEGSKWRTIPDLMFKYRTASWLIKTNCPEVLMGMQTTDELADIIVDARSSDATPFRRSLPAKTVDELVEEAEEAKQPAPEQPDRQPGDEPEEPEEIAVSRLLGEIPDMNTLKETTATRKAIPNEWSDANKQKVANKLDMREAEIRGGRGGKSNTMFDKEAK